MVRTFLRARAGLGTEGVLPSGEHAGLAIPGLALLASAEPRTHLVWTEEVAEPFRKGYEAAHLRPMACSRVWRVGSELVILSAPPLNVALSPFFLSLPACSFSWCWGPPWPHPLYSSSLSPSGTRPSFCWVGKKRKGQDGACGQQSVRVGTQVT